MAASPRAAAGLILRPADGVPTVRLGALGVTVRTLASTAETSGRLVAFDYEAPPGFRGPAPHWHAVATETFVGLAGTIRLVAGDRVLDLTPGAVGIVPPRTVHAFSNPGGQPARFLATLTPGMGFEAYFPALAELVRASPVWPPADPRPIIELAERYDTFAPPAPERGPSE